MRLMPASHNDGPSQHWMRIYFLSEISILGLLRIMCLRESEL